LSTDATEDIEAITICFKYKNFNFLLRQKPQHQKEEEDLLCLFVGDKKVGVIKNPVVG
jgi:hypothetical protein